MGCNRAFLQQVDLPDWNTFKSTSLRSTLMLNSTLRYKCFRESFVTVYVNLGGWRKIDPDGENSGADPFFVRCEMDGRSVTTEVSVFSFHNPVSMRFVVVQGIF